MRRRPYSVILFDEIEKAHPDVFNVLLQVLDDGRLTDGQGRVVDFKNTIIIMTSNLGSDLILDAGEKIENGGDAQKIHSELSEQIKVLLRQTFRPEFLNRIDETVMFRQLGKENIKGIVVNQLERVKTRLVDRHINLDFSDDAISFIAEKGYEPTMGARPVKRAIQTYVENPLSKVLLAGNVTENCTVKVDLDGDKQSLKFEISK